MKDPVDVETLRRALGDCEPFKGLSSADPGTRRYGDVRNHAHWRNVLRLQSTILQGGTQDSYRRTNGQRPPSLPASVRAQGRSNHTAYSI